MHAMEEVRGKSVNGVTIPPFHAPVAVEKKSFHAPAVIYLNRLGTDREIHKYAMHDNELKNTLTPTTKNETTIEGLVVEGLLPAQETADNNVSMYDNTKWKPCITVDSLTAAEVHPQTGF